MFVSGSAITGAQTLGHTVSHHTTTADKINQAEIVKIGLLIPSPEALSAKHGAELAIRQANENGGYFGRPYRLITRSTEGPWGTGSKESVNLVFEDEVLAIMGALDGRNAHLAEQVAAKTRTAFLSSRATDMSLSQAFVPWYYRCIPDDRQQAIALIQEIYIKRKIENAAIIASNDYDSQHAVNTFLKIAGSMNIARARQFLYKSSGKGLPDILNDIEKNNVKSIILFGDTPFASKIIPMLKQRNMAQPIFGSLSIMDTQKASSPDWAIFEDMILISSGHWFTDKGTAFQKEFQEAYGYQPGAAAAFAYDGINVIIEVIKRAGPGRNKIVDAFAETDYKNGVTGEIKFDVNGSRAGNAGLMIIKNGCPVAIRTKAPK
ncbi:Branched-chain amino acid ABC transporter, amino acid-binding protein (TC 3.A.1.4.1) [hydrothermal vent metagenome]|uniref:Branched-chain amino acid ABC transporter, amino acid-binding protein (TC 3.A.1.4.1) n=1 Tax=hydrothermal vent metagenome TaxID=652676 RepID=A0A3B0TZ46_9ZZZZ